MGKKAGKIELAWLHLRDAAPWGGIFLAVLLVTAASMFIADVTGTAAFGKWGGSSDCFGKGMSLLDNCEQAAN